MAESREKKESRRQVWRWSLGAPLLAVLVATAITSIAFPEISLFNGNTNDNRKFCHCAQDSRKFTGIVEDCCCHYETVSLNEEVLHPQLQELVTMPFFRYFKVKLRCNCPFWPDDGMCKLRDCSVCECPESEFPEPFKSPFKRTLQSDNLACQEGKPQATVDRTLDSKAFRGWIETDNPWTNDDETDNAEMTYVNLQLNPECYTGYAGPSARRIWDAIYSENCPNHSHGETLQEKNLLYKLISGLHSSISIHIAADYLLDETTNLASAYLEQAEYNTGNHAEDLKTQSLMTQLLCNPKLQAACPLSFDEAKLWQGQSGPELKQQFQKQFKHISALMDCVGCEKCRLWGKLQILGLGTALKILFSVDDQNHTPLQLQRNEVIALVNLLSRLSVSFKLVNEIRPSAEKLMGGQISAAPVLENRPWQRIWEFMDRLRLRKSPL
ncbi:endoplasmic reticulum oxidoreductin-1-like isoform X3 [Vitis riparia]|uniref:endoplasmic reticulum oxidoreductin-1-like isoform X3 n=1 Tax=Vitis riparia TaxID=96939 RepID=UPI00155A3C50|nr:endoplasmic reticulum oxidoreductin-1-like isoform X3 [Vitis riparia]